MKCNTSRKTHWRQSFQIKFERAVVNHRENRGERIYASKTVLPQCNCLVMHGEQAFFVPELIFVFFFYVFLRCSLLYTLHRSHDLVSSLKGVGILLSGSLFAVQFSCSRLPLASDIWKAFISDIILVKRQPPFTFCRIPHTLQSQKASIAWQKGLRKWFSKHWWVGNGGDLHLALFAISSFIIVPFKP